MHASVSTWLYVLASYEVFPLMIRTMQFYFQKKNHKLFPNFADYSDTTIFVSDPSLDTRNTRTNTCKSIENKHTNSTPQIIAWFYQPPEPIERVIFQKCVLAMVELLVTCHKSTRLLIDLCQTCHLAVFSFNSF